MSVLPLTPANFSGRWDLMSSSYIPYKMDRPSYCTPSPVENTPANNTCRMTELRGVKVASFNLGGDQYICLPQAFEYFLKHLVGGLHTVYTKLKRLNITPLVCNVEQVRILRGLGAIQPGVNRCKLITKEDFEALYYDCTKACRPGRPPKRYPLLSQPSDLTSRLHSNSALGSNDSVVTSPHKKMRFSLDSASESDKQDCDRSIKETESALPPPLPLPSPDLQNNPNPQLAYLQQTMRQQYQNAMALSGLQNVLDPNQPAAAQLLMMSHPAFFAPGVPSSALAMLNHFNRQITQAQQATGDALTSPKTETNQKQKSVNPEEIKNNDITQLPEYKRNEIKTQSNCNENQLFTKQSDKVGNRQLPSSAVDEKTDEERSTSKHATQSSLKSNEDLDNDLMRSDAHVTSTMQILLTQIQELLKLAASSANIQEKNYLTEIAKLKEMLLDEMKLREETQRKLVKCKKEKAETEKLLNEEKEERKKLDWRLFSLQKMLQNDASRNNSACDEDASSKSLSPLHKELKSSEARSESLTPPPHTPSVTSLKHAMDFSRAGAGVGLPSPTSSRQSSPNSINQNSNDNPVYSDERSSPDVNKQDLLKKHQRLFFNNQVVFQPTALQ